uniref:Uncharacterized protein n=1 Tax=Setaria digitata TaxID=48799 RepID=A0A915Q5J8_9BILA
MIESVGTKLFKSITKTADDLGSKFEIDFKNFSNKIAEDADVLALEFTALSNLIRIVLFILIILLLLIIFKYLTLGALFFKKRWFGSLVQPAKTQVGSGDEAKFFMRAVPVKVEMESVVFEKRCDNSEGTIHFKAVPSDGQFLLQLMKH